MDILTWRIRRLFDYGDLRATFSNDESSHMNLNMGPGDMSANQKARKKRRNMIIASAIFGIACVTIIAMALKHKKNVESAVDSFKKQHYDDLPRSSKKFTGSTIPEDKRIQLKDTVSGKFTPYNWYDFNGTWINDEEIIYQQWAAINIYNAASDTTRKIIGGNIMAEVDGYEMSADGNFIAIKVRINL